MKTVVYVFDGLRYDAVGVNGRERELTRNVDAMAREGINFTSAYAQGGWTVPSSASIFTGLYPESHGSHQIEQSLSGDHPNIAAPLAETDVVSACFSTNNVVSSERGFGRSFDEFYDVGAGGTALRPDVMDRLNEALLPWVRDHADESFFVVVWAMGTHCPFLTPEEVSDGTAPSGSRSDRSGRGFEALARKGADEAELVKSWYERSVEYADERFGDLVSLLRTDGLLEETALIVTSDHGNVFDEHPRLRYTSPMLKRFGRRLIPSRIRRYYGLFDPVAFVGHQAVLPYEELVHVPLVFKPADTDSVRIGEFDGFVELVDVFPTIPDLFGVANVEETQGTSLIERVQRHTGEDFVFSSTEVDGGDLVYHSVRNDEGVLIELDVAERPPREYLDLRSIQSILTYLVSKKSVLLDPDDETNVLRNDRLESELGSRLGEHLENCGKIRSGIGGDHVELPEETREQLDALGYH